MSRLLISKGHLVEVFVSRPGQDREMLGGKLKVWHAAETENLLRRAALRFFHLTGQRSMSLKMKFRSQARSVAALVGGRHRQAPFDAIQTADYRAVGLYLRPRVDCPVITRCSSPIDLYHEADGIAPAVANAWLEAELAALRSSDLVYAPSQFTADHYNRNFGLNLSVVRPPMELRGKTEREPSLALPPKYFLHFGTLCSRKGTDVLFKALAKALITVPEMKLVVIGRGAKDQIMQMVNGLGDQQSAAMMHSPMEKDAVMPILRDAHASVTPSIVDNLPNTVIESLCQETPVIGTFGTSIDEVVTDGETGSLVPPNDVDALAAAMIASWKSEKRFNSQNARDRLEMFFPENAYNSLMESIEMARERTNARG